MNPRADSVTVLRLSRPHVVSVLVGILFSAVAVFYIRLAIDLTPEENAYRRIVMVVVSIVIILLGIFIHLYLFRRLTVWLEAYRHHTSSQLKTGFLQDVWVDINNYPVKFCGYTFGYALYGVVLFTGIFIVVPFVIHSISSIEYLIHLIATVSLIAWPMGTLQFFVLERNQRKVAGIFLAENSARIRLNDPRIIRLSVRTKLLTAFFTTTGMASLFVGATLYYSLNRSPDEFVFNLLVALVITLGYGSTVALLAARSVTDSIHGIEYSVRSPGSKDQTDWVRIPSGFSTDELGFLYSSLSRFFETFRSSVRDIQRDVRSLQDQAQDMVSNAHRRTAVVAKYQDSVKETSEAIQDLTLSLNQVTGEGEQVSSLIGEGLQAMETGKELLAKTVSTVEQARQEASRNSKRVMDLSLKMMRIEEVIKIINYVTDQTKILAFNASIETAGAGETGERFGVVTKEIRQLAQNIASSTEEIKKIIEDVRQATHGSVLAAEKELKQIEAGLEYGGEADRAFTELLETVRKAGTAMAGVTEKLAQHQAAHAHVWNRLKALDQETRDAQEHHRAVTHSSESVAALSANVAGSMASLSDHP